jgi:hypothetical protein
METILENGDLKQAIADLKLNELSLQQQAIQFLRTPQQ